MSGGTRVTLFAITEPGLFQLPVAGSGAYDLELGIAGDVYADGKVDGADGAAVAAALAGSDISGDGLVAAVARPFVAANYGCLAHMAPVLAEVLHDAPGRASCQERAGPYASK